MPDRQLHGRPAEPVFAIDASDSTRILNALDCLVYVADMDTHELLFLNRYGQRLFKVEEGARCWQVLQANQTGPCAFCTNSLLLDAEGKPRPVHVWDFQNTRTGRWYQCRDQALRWTDGRLVRLETATDITSLKIMESQLQRAQRKAESLSRTDELTGLNNRRAFFALGETAVRQALAESRALSVVMFDVDHFKAINDRFGHQGGDQVLRSLGAALRDIIRDEDLVGRYGGEEFGLILPDTDLQQALRIAERLRQRINALPLGSATQQCCSASFGVATLLHPASVSLQDLIREADRALYEAKRKGRNRVEAATAACSAPQV